jgi:sarcosine oxidase delta subunit
METEEQKKERLNVYYCPSRHMVVTSEPVVPGWKAPDKITCPHCHKKAETCFHPDGIQDRGDLVELNFYQPKDHLQVKKSLEANRPNEVWTYGRAWQVFERLNFYQQFYYNKTK